MIQQIKLYFNRKNETVHPPACHQHYKNSSIERIEEFLRHAIQTGHRLSVLKYLLADEIRREYFYEYINKCDRLGSMYPYQSFSSLLDLNREEILIMKNKDFFVNKNGLLLKAIKHAMSYLSHYPFDPSYTLWRNSIANKRTMIRTINRSRDMKTDMMNDSWLKQFIHTADDLPMNISILSYEKILSDIISIKWMNQQLKTVLFFDTMNDVTDYDLINVFKELYDYNKVAQQIRWCLHNLQYYKQAVPFVTSVVTITNRIGVTSSYQMILKPLYCASNEEPTEHLFLAIWSNCDMESVAFASTKNLMRLLEILPTILTN
jgi:hypothetical protein